MGTQRWAVLGNEDVVRNVHAIKNVPLYILR